MAVAYMTFLVVRGVLSVVEAMSIVDVTVETESALIGIVVVVKMMAVVYVTCLVVRGVLSVVETMSVVDVAESPVTGAAVVVDHRHPEMVNNPLMLVHFL